jgi:predicted Rossmann-fold nucleotide-binding protein
MHQADATQPQQALSSVLPIVGVMGSGSKPLNHRATTLGKWLGTQPVHLLTGGGGGAMESVCAAFASVEDRQGNIIGILPGGVNESGYQPMHGYPNPWIEIPIRTHLPLSGAQGTDLASRNHINVLTPSVIVVLPGGASMASRWSLICHREMKSRACRRQSTSSRSSTG